MASLKHEIVTCERVRNARKYNEQHLRLKKHAQQKEETLPTQRMPSNNSLEQHITHAVKFGQWCKEKYRCRHFEDCRAYIQDYADYLKEKGLSAATIHTYLAGVCFVWEVPMDRIKKPPRRCADITRSRGAKDADQRADMKRECSERLYDFASAVGVRRKEYQRLRRNALVTDESGHLCVLIKRGKGGKVQLQRVLPEDVEDVKAQFNGTTDYVFSQAEMNNKIDLHHLRAIQAQRAYRYYRQRLEDDPAYREQLSSEIEKRWKKYNKRTWNAQCLEGDYVLRGRNRAFALKNGLPIRYERLPLMAVSVFHLAHWRCDVTVANYLLAV